MKKIFSFSASQKPKIMVSFTYQARNPTKGQKMINATFTPSYEKCANVMCDVCYGLDVDARTMRDFTIYFWNNCAAARIDPETDAGFIIARSIRNGYLRGLEA